MTEEINMIYNIL